MKINYLSVVFLCLTVCGVQAQYHPQKIFKTNDFYKHKGDAYRSASGKPGSAYWQNEADYAIDASFNPEDRILKGKVKIDYTNNSPDNLDNLWLQLDQNTTKNTAEVNIIQQPIADEAEDSGYHINTIQIEIGGEKREIKDYNEYGTRLHIPLQEALKTKDSAQLVIEYTYKLQEQGGGDRSGYMDTEDGKIYEFSYWYPRMAVYDDYYGWNTLPFIGGGEMYLDYGTIDYNLTVPSDQVVVGSGVLQNKNKLLDKKTLKRLDKARSSEETVMVRKPTELTRPVTNIKKDKVTWHFTMQNTRDVAWAMSTAFVWDAAKINLSGHKTALAQSVYPKKALEENRGWKRSTEMMKASVEFFSDYLLDYPYEVATSVGGSVGGMEFPGLVFNHWDVEEDIMFLLASHEIGHTWFPMIVGSDERRDPFMDEGLNVFMDIYAQEDFNDGEFAPKRDGEYAPDGGNPNEEIVAVIESAKEGPTIMTAADNMDYKYVHPLDYFKAAHGLVLLREVVLGHDKFDYAFKQYAKNWAYKHPRPEDFFRSMENNSGEDLSWFWQGWFYHNWQLDQEVKSVAYTDDSPEKGAEITVRNNDQMVMPVLVRVEEENGETHNFQVPVDLWKNGAEATFKVATHAKLKKVVLDPEKALPDADRANNEWTED